MRDTGRIAMMVRYLSRRLGPSVRLHSLDNRGGCMYINVKLIASSRSPGFAFKG